MMQGPRRRWGVVDRFGKFMFVFVNISLTMTVLEYFDDRYYRLHEHKHCRTFIDVALGRDSCLFDY